MAAKFKVRKGKVMLTCECGLNRYKGQFCSSLLILLVMLHHLDETKTFQQQSHYSIFTRLKASAGISNVKQTTPNNTSHQINRPVTSKFPNQTKVNLAKKSQTNRPYEFQTCASTTNPKQPKRHPQQATRFEIISLPQAVPKLKRIKPHFEGLIKHLRK